MLLYVDKKKEKRRKVKIFLFILLSIFILLANFSHFFYALHHTPKKLTTYKTSKKTNDWYLNAQPAILFASRKTPIKAILVPKEISRENLITTISIFAELKNKIQMLKISPKTPLFSEIKQAAQIFSPDLKISDENFDTIITPDINEITDLIKSERLFPSTFNYKQATPLENTHEIKSLVNTTFPLPIPPKNSLEKEWMALNNFIKENEESLMNFIKNDTPPIFAVQNAFLKNIRICMITKNDTLCKTQDNISLQKNIIDIKNEIPKNQTVKKLIFLTSDEEIFILKKQKLEQNEGLHFCYQNKEAFIFPKEIPSLEDLKKDLIKLKEKAGINPEYTTTDMKLYKFKIVEVNIDEKI